MSLNFINDALKQLVHGNVLVLCKPSIGSKIKINKCHMSISHKTLLKYILVTNCPIMTDYAHRQC